MSDETLQYARDVLKGPFPMGEAEISRDPDCSLEYARDVLRGPFPQGEQAIARSAVASIGYAAVIRGPFPAGEPVISMYPKLQGAYQHVLIHGVSHGHACIPVNVGFNIITMACRVCGRSM